jgi:predicted dehydrogenase
MSEPIGIAVLGLGGRGRYFAKSWPENPAARLVACCEIDPQVAAFAKQDVNAPEDCAWYADMHEMLADPRVEAVIVATHDRHHRECGEAVLRAGKHLFLEKPMAQTIADCDALIEAWQQSRTVFMIGLELRFCTLCATMKQILDRGDIGEVRLGYAVDNVSVGGQYYFHGPRRRQEYTVSLLLEKGTHTLDLMNWFIGARPRRVFCEGGLDVFGGDAPDDLRCRDCEKIDTCPYALKSDRFVMDYGETVVKPDFCVWAKEVDVDDNGVLTCRYDNGAKMTYVECHFTPDYNRRFTLIGTAGRMEAFYNNEQDFRIELTYRHSDRRDEIFPGTSTGGHGGGDPRIRDEFLRLVRAGEPCCPGVLGARNSAAIAIAAHASSKSGLPSEIPPSPVDEDESAL